LLKIIKLFKFWLVVWVLILTGLVLGFSGLNAQTIYLSFYIYQSPSLPLFVFLILAFLAGACCMWLMMLPLYFSAQALKKQQAKQN